MTSAAVELGGYITAATGAEVAVRLTCGTWWNPLKIWRKRSPACWASILGLAAATAKAYAALHKLEAEELMFERSKKVYWDERVEEAEAYDTYYRATARLEACLRFNASGNTAQ